MNSTVQYKITNDDINKDGSYNIPEGVTTIDDGAFSDCLQLKTIELPERVTTIGPRAFSGCRNLETIKLPEGVTTIGGGAFSHCYQLKTIEFPKGVTTIANSAFSNCRNLEMIKLPEGVTIIGGGAFSHCYQLKTIEFPEGVTIIGGGAFSHCYQLKTIEFPESVTIIGGDAFSHCHQLKTIELPEGVTTIGYEVFGYCSNLQTVTIPESVESIADNAFEYCPQIHSVVIASKDDAAIQRIKALLPTHLQDKVLSMALAEEAFELLNAQRSIVVNMANINPLYPFFNLNAPYISKARKKNEAGEEEMVECKKLPDEMFAHTNSFLIDDNIYYQNAEGAMRRVPLPQKNEEMEGYKKQLEQITVDIINKAQRSSSLQNSYDKQLEDIANKEIVLRQEGHVDAANAAKKLHQKIKISYKESFPSNMAQFKKEYRDALNEACSLLEYDSYWALIFNYSNVASTVFGGLIVLSDIGYKYATGNHFSFFQTEIALKTSALAEVLDELSELQETLKSKGS